MKAFIEQATAESVSMSRSEYARDYQSHVHFAGIHNGAGRLLARRGRDVDVLVDVGKNGQKRDAPCTLFPCSDP